MRISRSRIASVIILALLFLSILSTIETSAQANPDLVNIYLESRKNDWSTSNLGTIQFEPEPWPGYSLPTMIWRETAPFYQALYFPPSRHVIDHWEISGGIQLVPPYQFPDSPLISVQVTGPGTMIAVYKEVPATIHLESREIDSTTSNLGTMDFDDASSLNLPYNIQRVTSGSPYPATYYPPSQHEFDHWETTDGVSVPNPYSGPTTDVYVSYDGTLRAIYKDAPLPPYDATIAAYCYTEGTDPNVSISPAGVYTPHTFVGLTGDNQFTVPSVDPSGHPFKQWNTDETTTTIVVTSAGTYTAYYEQPNNPPLTPTTPEWTSGEHILIGTPTYSEEFRSQATDPDGDDVKITFDWGDGTYDTTDWVPSGSQVDKYHSWAYPGMFEIKTKATDIHSVESSWSSPLEVTVVTTLGLGNWAGYMVESPTDPITSVEGSWTVPEFGTELYGLQGIWVGVGGYDYTPLLQCGVVALTNPDREDPFYCAFWETVPGWGPTFDDPDHSGCHIYPGDTIWAKVSESPTMPEKWRIEVEDLSRGWAWGWDGIDATPDQTTAEWVFEPGAGPFWGTNVASSFTPIVFGGAKLEIGSTVYDIGRVGQSVGISLYRMDFWRDGEFCANVSLISSYRDFEILDSGLRPKPLLLPIPILSLFSSAELHVYDSLGNHLGYNSTSGLVDARIPNSFYFEDEGVQYALLFNPDEYQIDLVGKETGDFHLHTQIVTNETVTLDRWVNDTITIDETKTYYLIHQISLQDLENSKTVTGQGYNCSISIVVFNDGNYTETFNLTAYANTTIIGTQLVTLTHGNSTAVTFIWNTKYVPYGNYTISANATIVSGEIDTADNTLPDGWVFVTIPGDINGDRIVDIYDAILLAVAFGSELGDDNWNPNEDINGDNIVDIYDAIILATLFGETV